MAVSRWTLWLFCVACCFDLARPNSRNIIFSVFKLYDDQIKAYDAVDPEVGQSCHLRQPNRSSDLFVMCPTEVSCYLKTYSKGSAFVSYQVELEGECKATKGKPLSVSKTRQIETVLRVLRLSNETECEFASIETLDARANGLVNMERLGGVNCGVENAGGDVSKCPYKLKYLNLSFNKIDKLLNRSFCQFRQLEHLSIANCELRSIESDAFVDLINLKEISLRLNYVTRLPIDVFINNLHLENVDLMHNDLRVNSLSAFSTIDSLRYLYLAENFIALDDNSQIFPATLSHLFLNTNEVENAESAFANLSNLTRLIMDSNKIRRVGENAFQQLRSVQAINLNSNRIERLHENAFKSTLKVEELYLKENQLSEFPPIAHLALLRELKLSKNRISSIRKTDLINCTQLSYIDLSDNRLMFIEDGSFDNAIELQKLYLENNRLSESSVNLKSSNIVQLSFVGNNFTAFSYEIIPRSVTRLWFSSNQIQTIEPFDFGSGRKGEWALANLFLDQNRIESIKNLSLPFSIKSVELSSNRIREIFSLHSVNNQYLFNLQVIRVKNNNISSICKTLFQGFKPVIRIQYFISNNPFECSAENLWIKYSPELDYFEFADLQDIACQQTLPNNRSQVKLSQLSDKEFLSRSDHVNNDRCECPPDGVTQCELPCPSDCTCYSDLEISIVRVFCDNKQFQNIPSDLQHLNYQNASVTLDLSSNNISHLGPIAFRSSNDRITLLDLRSSSIKSILRDAFIELIHLKSLDLSHNQLEALPNGLFNRLTKLTTLDLSNNHLTYLADNIFSFTNSMQYLFLHRNNLSHIQLSEIKQLNSLNNVSFHENPWSCDCAFIEPFRAFLVDSTTTVYDKLRVNCTENGRQFNIPNFNIEHCFKQIHLTIVIVSLTFGLITMTAIGVTFKWRYELQVLIYSRYGLRIFHRKPLGEEVEGKQFDAFMAYNSQDSDFLVEQLLPGLEEIEIPYRILIHERDFLAGGYIQDNIIEAVKISSRTIIVLSENFVRSGWCRFEFKTAHVQMLEDRCPRVLVIVLGEIPETLDPEMQLYLKTNTYLKWSEKLFWQKLYYAMPDQRVASPPTNAICEYQ